jgi:RNase adapter protein RapZ
MTGHGTPSSSPPGSRRPTVVVVSGLSGAGKSTALRALEDLGFFCTDNLPTVLSPQAVELCEHGGMTRVALGIDVRVRAFLGEFGNVISMLENGKQREVHVIFLDASDETLFRRFSETRRPHPLNADGGSPGSHEGAIAVLDGIHLERERLAPLRARATHEIDTTRLSVHELRRTIITAFGPSSGGAPRMATRIVSFGFKYGTPMDADLVLDVRFLDNPYFVPELRHLPGTDPAVVKYVLALPETTEFLARTRELLAYVMPKYEREGKSYLTIAIGCTGGRHRSVVLADVLARALQPFAAQAITVAHRDVLQRDPWMRPEPDQTHAPGLVPAVPDSHEDLGTQVSTVERLGIAQPLGYPERGPR